MGFTSSEEFYDQDEYDVWVFRDSDIIVLLDESDDDYDVADGNIWDYTCDPDYEDTYLYEEGVEVVYGFYMPKLPETEVVGSTSEDGDRLEVGDLLFVWAGKTDATEDGYSAEEECQDEVTGVALTMGAASLAVASSTALALAFGI